MGYQTLDNMDGKQARRIGLASPLGLLMDHGVDAVNITLSALNIMALFRLGDSLQLCLIVWFCGAFPFFFATWEEFYTGTLYLGIINGPTDGVLIVCGVFLLSSFVEDYTAFWNAPLLEPALELPVELSRKEAAIGFFVTSVVFTVLSHLLTVLRLLHWSARGAERCKDSLKHVANQRRPRLRDAMSLKYPSVSGRRAQRHGSHCRPLTLTHGISSRDWFFGCLAWFSRSW